MFASFVIKCVCIVAVATILSSESVQAQLQCPQDSWGTFPECVCFNGNKFNQVHGECPPQHLKQSWGGCPKFSFGHYPNCDCPIGKVYDHKHSVCLDLDRTKCPKKSFGDPPYCNCEQGLILDDVHWICRPVVDGQLSLCPDFHHWNGTQCLRTPCPDYTFEPEGKFYPDCQLSGPVSCPPFQNYNAKENRCQTVKCAPGSIGDIYPNCIMPLNRKVCPPEFPGEWPHCKLRD